MTTSSLKRNFGGRAEAQQRGKEDTYSASCIHLNFMLTPNPKPNPLLKFHKFRFNSSHKNKNLQPSLKRGSCLNPCCYMDKETALGQAVLS